MFVLAAANPGSLIARCDGRRERAPKPDGVNREGNTSGWCEHDAPGDLSPAQLIQDFVGVVQGASGGMTA